MTQSNKILKKIHLTLLMVFPVLAVLMGAMLLSSTFIHAQAEPVPFEMTPGEAFGTIDTPPGTAAYSDGTGENQLLPFISTLLTVGAVVAGLWVLINIFMAGITSVTSGGDSAALGKVRGNITNSVIGLLLIVLAYTIAALAGAIFFGDSTLFTQPSFSAPTF